MSKEFDEFIKQPPNTSCRLLPRGDGTANVISGFAGYILVVSGRKPCYNMQVILSPVIEVAPTDYQPYEVVGCMQGAECAIGVVPYDVSIDLLGTRSIGKKGVEVVWADHRLRIDVPPGRAKLAAVAPPQVAASPAAAPAVSTWEGEPGQNNGVRHLFTPKDIDHMKSDIVAEMTGRAYALDDYDDVKANAVKIYGMVRTKQMPPGSPWSDDMLLRFKNWMDNGFPR